MTALRVLVVEDQPAVSQALGVLFDVHGIPFDVAARPEDASRLVESGSIGVVIQDMNFSPSATSGAEGVALFRELRLLAPELPVLLMTAWTSLETAVQLVKEGASDYFAKPWDDAKLLASVRSLLKLRELTLENQRLRAAASDLEKTHDLCGLVYENAAMHRLVRLALQVAPSDAAILITGPNGSGKEKIAEIVQANSKRKGKPFVRVNAGGLPDDLLEAELFGAEAGAYTGSKKLRIGRFEAAHGGTLFLDEIGNLSAAGQMKLLRVLQSREFERLGSSETRRVDVRLLCATNADLPKEIEAGRFREDLYFRLNVIELPVPPLRDRKDDVLPLARSVLGGLAPRDDGEPFQLTRDAEEALLAYTWPGNVRELVNRVQRASLVAPSPRLSAADFGFEAPLVPSTRTPEEEDERAALEKRLRDSGGSVSRAADDLGLSRQALYRRMERLGIVLERRPRD